ncbi:MAG: transporter substrate-binding domain-containing protein [Sporolactobacillus sp.]
MKKFRKWIVVVATVLALTLILGACSAGTSNSGSKAEKTIKIATTGVSFPGSFKEKGTLKGFDVDLAKKIAQRLGYKVKWVNTDFDGLFGQLDSGKVDLIASNVTVTPERSQKYYFSKPYGYFNASVVVKKNSKLEILHDLKNKTVAATIGSNNIAIMKKYDSSIKIKTFEDRDAAVGAVINGQVDGYANSAPILKALIEQKKLPLKVLKGSAEQDHIAFTFSKTEKGKRLQKQFNNELIKLKQNGQASKISEKYFGGEDVTHK